MAVTMVCGKDVRGNEMIKGETFFYRLSLNIKLFNSQI